MCGRSLRVISRSAMEKLLGSSNALAQLSSRRMRALAPHPHAALISPAFEKGILMMNDGGRLGENDRNRIKANLVPGDTGLRGVTAGGPSDIPLFGCVDGAVGSTEFRGAARFHLYKDDNVAVASHNVNLCFTAARTVVSGQNREPRPTQIAMGTIFALSTESRFRSETASLTELSRCVAH